MGPIFLGNTVDTCRHLTWRAVSYLWEWRYNDIFLPLVRTWSSSYPVPQWWHSPWLTSGNANCPPPCRLSDVSVASKTRAVIKHYDFTFTNVMQSSKMSLKSKNMRSVFFWYFLFGYFLGFNLVKTPQGLGNWFQRNKHLKDFTNNINQSKLSALVGCILKTILASSDSFCLITSQIQLPFDELAR